MRIIVCKVRFFGAYRDLSYVFENKGLILIYGPTGSGKSALLDIPVWIITGRTAKGGSVDEVKSWHSEGLPTIGQALIATTSGNILVTRIRGRNSENDLYWQEMDKKEEEPTRGKDLSDTQVQLEARLGINSDFFATASYYNEFSQTNHFFLAKAKDRREVFEKIANLDLPIALAEKSSLKRKETKKELDELHNSYTSLNGRSEQLKVTILTVQKHFEEWERTQSGVIEDIIIKAKDFDKNKQAKLDSLNTKSYQFESEKTKKVEDLVDKLDDLDQNILPVGSLEKRIETERNKIQKNNIKCTSCKRPIEVNPVLTSLLKQLEVNNRYRDRFSDLSSKLKETQKTKNPYTALIQQAEKETNQYNSQVDVETSKMNPFTNQIVEVSESQFDLFDQIKAVKAKIAVLQYRYNALDQLYDLSFVLRAALLKNTVSNIQGLVNDALSKYFDSEFQVRFELDKSDSLSVEIKKDGNSCVYTQLSKGQRQLLKLCFSIAVMKTAANNSGIHFNLLSFDEPCDGLDEELKIKAFRMFEDLAQQHETVLVVDHTPGFQNMFSNKNAVSLIGDESTVTDE